MKGRAGVESAAAAAAALCECLRCQFEQSAKTSDASGASRRGSNALFPIWLTRWTRSLFVRNGLCLGPKFLLPEPGEYRKMEMEKQHDITDRQINVPVSFNFETSLQATGSPLSTNTLSLLYSHLFLTLPQNGVEQQKAAIYGGSRPCTPQELPGEPPSGIGFYAGKCQFCKSLQAVPVGVSEAVSNIAI